MKPRVLLIGNFLSASGGSRGVCEELALSLAANGTQVITTSHRRNRFLRLLDMVGTAIAQRNNYSVAQVDVFSGPAFLWAEMVCATLRRLHKPFVLTLHGGNLLEFAKKNPARVRRLLAYAEIVTAPSRFLLEKMSLYRADLRLVLNGVDISRCAFRERATPKPSLVWLRSFHEIYNPSLAPRVLSLLVKIFPDAQLTMIGPDKHDGSLQQAMRVAAELGAADRICFQGGVAKEEVPRWLQRGDIFLNTTNVDNAPVSVIEAMACGLCVVSTDVGGLPYLLKNKGTALLVPPNDAEKMAKAVERVLCDPRFAEKLSRRGRAQAEAHDWAAVLPNWNEIFQTLALNNFSASSPLLREVALHK